MLYTACSCISTSEEKTAADKISPSSDAMSYTVVKIAERNQGMRHNRNIPNYKISKPAMVLNCVDGQQSVELSGVCTIRDFNAVFIRDFVHHFKSIHGP